VIAAVESYIALRRATGYSMRDTDRVLRSFGRFAAERGDHLVQVKTILDWARRAKSAERREALVRKVAPLARHLHAEDPRHEIPAYRIFASDPFRRPVPYIFTKQQIAELVGAALRLGPVGSMRGQIYAALLSLLSATGLRISEALALRLEDVGTDGLHIRETKCHKSRLVPLHPTARVGLDRYLRRRRALAGDRVFVGITGRPIGYAKVKVVFRRLLAAVGIDRHVDGPRPRLHCLRHTLAVRALEACVDPCSVAKHQLALSTYLGHSSIASTYWYLEATPDLLAKISRGSEGFVEGYTR
jgi:integrase/recombinase XerD